jgi:hypothetical protein
MNAVAESKGNAKKVRPPVTGAFIRGGPPGHRMPRSRIYKPKGRPGRNMTLDNTNRTYTQSVIFVLIATRIVLGVLADTSAACGVYLWRSWFTNISLFFLPRSVWVIYLGRRRLRSVKLTNHAPSSRKQVWSGFGMNVQSTKKN